MASPQIEKGYTRIANELLDQIVKKNLNGTQFRLVLTIWRLTYGYQETENAISVRYLAEKMDMNKRQVERELKVLIVRKIVNVISAGQRGVRVMQVNKDYDQWDKQDSEANPIPKQKKKKSNIKPKYDEENTYYKMAVYFHNLVEKVGQEAGLTHLTSRANLQTWADDMRKLVELDKVDKKLAVEVMNWVSQDDFWKTNILSASKLRKQFPQLAIKMKADKQPRTKKQPMQKDSRDKEIALQKWIAEGNDPDAFNWSD